MWKRVGNALLEAGKRARFHGTDYNPELIAWCQKNMGNLAEFSRNKLKPPLTYANEKFDFICAISRIKNLYLFSLLLFRTVLNYSRQYYIW